MLLLLLCYFDFVDYIKEMTSQDGPNLTEFKEKMKQSHITRHFGVKRKSNSSCDVATLTDEDGKSEYFKNQSKKAKSCDKKRINLEQTNTEAATLPDCAKINDNEEDLDHEGELLYNETLTDEHS